MTTFVVEKDVPIPDKNKWNRVFDAMGVGDSFFIPASEIGGSSVAARWCAWRKDRSRQDVKFQQKKDESGIRVWRVK